MERTISDVTRTATIDYLNSLDINNPPDPTKLEAQLIEKIRFEFEIENSVKPKNRHWREVLKLDNATIARIIAKLHNVRKILYSGTVEDGNYDLGIYQTAGPAMGTYITDHIAIKTIISQYHDNITTHSKMEIIDMLLETAQCCNLTIDPDLIAVNNGVFNYATKELMPFSPDFVFIAKSKVDYNINARNTVIHNLEDNTDWDVESWVSDLSDDQGVTELLWQTIGSIIRPHVAWNKMICMYSEQGNNGKGTLCALMRNLSGTGTYASIPFVDFSKEFMLMQLTRSSSVIVDENDTCDFTKASAALKAVISGDYFSINRKYKCPITIKFRGAVVQCINSLPKFGDKSNSMYRRFLLIPFNKCFEGVERKYIKEDYLNRKEVLEYVLFKILNTNYYNYDEPQVCLDLLELYKKNNDTIRQFTADVLDELVWDVVPYTFLYDLYKSWHDRNNPSGTVTGKQGFLQQIKQILIGNETWVLVDTPTPTRGGMDKPEPIMLEYNLTEWQNKKYKGEDDELICTTQKKPKSFRGLRKK